MGEHRAQVVAWVRRHINPYELDETYNRKKMMRLDLVNLFELFLLKILKKHNLKPGKINDFVGREHIKKALQTEERSYLMLFGGTRMAIICNNPIALWQRTGGATSVLMVDFQKIKSQILEGIKKVRV